jgi:hypothetical protein
MKQFMMLVVLNGSFWVGQVWADMDRVSNSISQIHNERNERFETSFR